MWKYFSNLFLALFEGHSIGNSKKNFEIWKFVKKIFFGQEPKWWVKGTLESLFKKFLLEAWAEKTHLKIFLEASFFQAQAYLRISKIHAEHIRRNFEPKWFPSGQNEAGLHNVCLEFWYDGPFVQKTHLAFVSEHPVPVLLRYSAFSSEM